MIMCIIRTTRVLSSNIIYDMQRVCVCVRERYRNVEGICANNNTKLMIVFTKFYSIDIHMSTSHTYLEID